MAVGDLASPCWLPNGSFPPMAVGDLSLVLISGAILSKSLNQFSVDELSCGPSMLFGVTMVGVMVVMATSFKRTYASTTEFSSPDSMIGSC